VKITLEELRAWVAVVDSGSITAAADQLAQTSSGISRALSRLESKLQTTLLHRTTRRLALTEEGQVFLEHARQILASVEQAEEQIAQRREMPSGRLRVNAATPFMLHVIVPLVDAFRAQYPLIQLELNTDDILIDLLEQQTDVAIRIGELRDSTLRARMLGSSAIRLMASPAYLAKAGTPQTVADLEQHQIIGFSHLIITTSGRSGSPTASLCGSSRRSPPPVVKPSGNWRWPGRALRASPTLSAGKIAPLDGWYRYCPMKPANCGCRFTRSTIATPRSPHVLAAFSIFFAPRSTVASCCEL